MKNTHYINLAASLALLTLSSLVKSEVPTLQLTVDSQNPLPGSTINFTAKFDDSDEMNEAIAQIITGINLKSSEGINELDTTYPYQWSIPLLNSASGVDEFKAITLLGAEVIVSNAITITIKPDISTLKQIYFDPGHLLPMAPANTEQLVVMGRFSDGYNREITLQILGATYTENIVDGLTITPGDSPVISVSEDGVITALQEGEAEVVATNNGLSNVRRIQVVAGDKPPVAQCQNVTVSADESCQVAANVDNGSFDPDGDPITLAQSPSEPYALGDTNVTLTVTDDKGGSSSCSAVVTVIDTVAPEMSVLVSPGVLWPPNHQMRHVTATVEASDACDVNPSIVLTSVVSNEPDNGKADGNTVNDIQGADTGINDRAIMLRAERSGKGNGRIYTITYGAMDASGNTVTGSATVTVPHSQ